jgi:hypothetical protein
MTLAILGTALIAPTSPASYWIFGNSSHLSGPLRKDLTQTIIYRGGLSWNEANMKKLSAYAKIAKRIRYSRRKPFKRRDYLTRSVAAVGNHVEIGYLNLAGPTVIVRPSFVLFIFRADENSSYAHLVGNVLG